MTTERELDAMKEHEDAKMWEELNRENKPLAECLKALDEAAEALDTARSKLIYAACVVAYTPETHRIISLATAAEDLQIDTDAMKERMKPNAF